MKTPHHPDNTRQICSLCGYYTMGWFATKKHGYVHAWCVDQVDDSGAFQMMLFDPSDYERRYS